MTKFKTISYIICFLLIVIIIWLVYINYSNCKFWNITFVEAFQLIFLILIPFFISKYINLSTSFDLKRREVILGHFKSLQTLIDSIFEKGFTHLYRPEDTTIYNEILADITRARNTIYSIVQAVKKCKSLPKQIIDEDSYKRKMLDFKQSITDIDREEQIEQQLLISKSYRELSNLIFESEIRICS